MHVESKRCLVDKVRRLNFASEAAKFWEQTSFVWVQTASNLNALIQLVNITTYKKNENLAFLM